MIKDPIIGKTYRCASRADPHESYMVEVLSRVYLSGFELGLVVRVRVVDTAGWTGDPSIIHIGKVLIVSVSRLSSEGYPPIEEDYI